MAYKVLIVDDEEIVCRGLAKFVKWQEYGFSVEGIAYSVDEALALMERTAMDVVFMDIRMPGKTGLDMLQIIQKSYPGVKSVILSGFSEFSYAREAIRYGAVDYLNKPVNLKEVEELLERLGKDFMEERRAQEVRNNRIEGLLLSAVKGYSRLEQEKYQLPVLEWWHGLSMELLSRELSEEEIIEKKKLLRAKIMAIVPDAYLLDCNVYELFAIIPCKNEAEADHFVDILEQTCQVGLEWSCGISKFKHGIGALREAYEESGKALRYHRASEKRGMIWYKKYRNPVFPGPAGNSGDTPGAGWRPGQSRRARLRGFPAGIRTGEYLRAENDRDAVSDRMYPVSDRAEWTAAGHEGGRHRSARPAE